MNERMNEYDLLKSYFLALKDFLHSNRLEVCRGRSSSVSFPIPPSSSLSSPSSNISKSAVKTENDRNSAKQTNMHKGMQANKPAISNKNRQTNKLVSQKANNNFICCFYMW